MRSIGSYGVKTIRFIQVKEFFSHQIILHLSAFFFFICLICLFGGGFCRKEEIEDRGMGLNF